jgi:DNA replication protein DnaC
MKYYSLEGGNCAADLTETEFSEKMLDIARSHIAKMVPALYQDTDEERLPAELLTKVREWSPGHRGLALMGKTGTGKTRSVYLRLSEILKAVKISQTTQKHWVCKIPLIAAINDAAFARLVREAAWNEGLSARRQLKLFYIVNILFIDDLGQSKMSDLVTAELYSLVEYRTSNLLPIIFTTNYSCNQLEEKMIDKQEDKDRGMAITRRLSEFCDVVKT